jgi:hypothetical protein
MRYKTEILIHARQYAFDRVRGLDSDDLVNFALDRMDTLPPQPASEWTENFLINFALNELMNDYLKGLNKSNR